MPKNKKPDKQLLKRLFVSESGQAMIEFMFLIIIFVFILLSIIYMISKFPSLIDNAILLAVVGAFLGGIAWSGKQLLKAIANHAQFHILEILSSGKPLSRNEIKPLLNKRLFACKIIPGLEVDALQLLTQSNKIVVKDSKYTIAPSTTSNDGDSPKRKRKEMS